MNSVLLRFLQWRSLSFTLHFNPPYHNRILVYRLSRCHTWIRPEIARPKTPITYPCRRPSSRNESLPSAPLSSICNIMQPLEVLCLACNLDKHQPISTISDINVTQKITKPKVTLLPISPDYTSYYYRPR